MYHFGQCDPEHIPYIADQPHNDQTDKGTEYRDGDPPEEEATRASHHQVNEECQSHQIGREKKIAPIDGQVKQPMFVGKSFGPVR